MGLPLLLLQHLGAPLAKVGQMHKTNGLRLEHVLGGDALARKGPRRGGLAILIGRHSCRWLNAPESRVMC